MFFSSVNAIRKYTMEELVQLGVSWIWVGLESPNSTYAKLKNSDTTSWPRSCEVTVSSCWDRPSVGLEHHTPENIREEIEYAVEHHTDFHQFMLYTPVRARPLFFQMEEEKRMLDNVDLADIHGQFKFNFKHAAISRDDSQRFLDWAFRFDFEKNGPSLYRICETMFKGWKRYKNHPDSRVRERFLVDGRKLKSTYNASLWAMEKRLKTTNATVSAKIGVLRREIEGEFGLVARLIRSVAGPLLLWTSKREEKRLARGVTYEPPTIVDRRNWQGA